MRTMGIPPALDGVVLVLDRPRDVTNVGGVVRAMGNFGLARLRLVEPAAYDPERVLAMAHCGAPVLARLERRATLLRCCCPPRAATLPRPRPFSLAPRTVVSPTRRWGAATPWLPSPPRR